MHVLNNDQYISAISTDQNYSFMHTWRPSIMANGTIAFDTLSTSGQITGTAKSVDTDYVVNGSAKDW